MEACCLVGMMNFTRSLYLLNTLASSLHKPFHIYRDKMKLDKSRLVTNADVMTEVFLIRWRGEGNSYRVEDFTSLTSDGTVADRRGEGHHFNVGGVKQA